MIKNSLEQLVEELARILTAVELRMATAESCTGGWISQVLTAIPGSSNWFEGGVVSYSNTMKQSLLDVPREILEQYGAVSTPVVEHMARGVACRLDVPVSVAVSGIAGPGGGSEEKPVGTVHIAWFYRNNVFSEEFLFDGNREQVRHQTVEVALSSLVRLLKTMENSTGQIYR